jgi:hypothetical protein
MGFGLVILLSFVGSVISYNDFKRIDRELHQVISIEGPLEKAVLEMEINAGETARAVLDYVRDLEHEHIVAMRDSERDFERFAMDFEHLAETAEERRLGQEVAGLYREFKMMGDKIVALADRRRDALEAFRRYALEIDGLIDDELQKPIHASGQDGMKKLHSALDMEINIFKAFAAIEGYAARPDPALRSEIENAEADFERFEARYRETNLSIVETDLLDRIGRAFIGVVSAGDRIISFTDELNENLEEFETHL